MGRVFVKKLSNSLNSGKTPTTITPSLQQAVTKPSRFKQLGGSKKKRLKESLQTSPAGKKSGLESKASLIGAVAGRSGDCSGR